MLKGLHVVTVVVTMALFLLRGYWLHTQPQKLAIKWVRIVPHINDSILLITAILLAIEIQQYPFVNDWLTAKVIALVIYILLGMVALRWGKTQQVRSYAWLAAFVVFLYIVSVAILKTPYGFAINFM